MKNTIKDGGQAFPAGVDGGFDRTGEPVSQAFPGMSLRDYFAGQALAGMHACSDWMNAVAKTAEKRNVDTTHIVAYASYMQADAMIAERNRKDG